MKVLFYSIVLTSLIASCVSEVKKENTGETPKLQAIDSPADSVSAEPYLFTDKNGGVYLSWITKETESSSLKYSVLKNGKWSEPSVIATGNQWFVNWADYPMLASDGNNNMAAHFLEKSEKGTYTYDVKLTVSADQGKTWSIPKILHDDGKKAEHGFVSIVPFRDKYFISWLDRRNAVMDSGEGHHAGHNGQMTIRGALVDKQGNKSAEWELDNRVCDCCQTSAAITNKGPVVVYRDRTEEEIRDISIVRFENGIWSSPKPVFQDNWKTDGCPVNGPKVDVLGNSLAVAWFSAADKNARVNVIFSKDDGATFNVPIRVDEGNAIGRVDLIMLDEKSAMVSWMEGSLIKAAKVYANGTKEPSIVIASSSETRASGFPQMTKSGNILVFAWSDTKEKKIMVATYSL